MCNGYFGNCQTLLREPVGLNWGGIPCSWTRTLSMPSQPVSSGRQAGLTPFQTESLHAFLPEIDKHALKFIQELKRSKVAKMI